MNYKQMIEQARANGMATEKNIWAAVETLSTDLLVLEQTDPKLYWHILRRQHAVLYGRHYSEKMANHVCRPLRLHERRGDNQSRLRFLLL